MKVGILIRTIQLQDTKISNDIIVQWGTALKGKDGVAITVTFPTTYNDISLIYIQRERKDTYAKEHTPCVWTRTVNSFSFKVRGINGNSLESAYNYCWLSVGFQ